MYEGCKNNSNSTTITRKTALICTIVMRYQRVLSTSYTTRVNVGDNMRNECICALSAKKRLRDVIVEFAVTHTEIASKKKGNVEIVQGSYVLLQDLWMDNVD